MIIKDVTDERKCCCSCKHNKRTRYGDKMRYIRCNCDKDGHYIGYVANFESVCDEWEGDTE